MLCSGGVGRLSHFSGRRLHHSIADRQAFWLSCPGLGASRVLADGQEFGRLESCSQQGAAQSGMQATCSPTCSDMWASVSKVYDRAQQIGAATKTDTKAELLRDEALSIDFVVRVATALQKKPKGDTTVTKATAGAKKEWRNPFLPYEEALWVHHLSDSHTLLLNKFNVVAHHLLVVTRQFESQQDPLNAKDLEATWQVIKAMPQGGLAFYNCGEHSGRSQPHKHLQVVPLPFTEGIPPQPPIHPLVVAAATQAGAAPLQAFPVRQLPYVCYAALLQDNPSPEQLEATFQQLLAKCAAAASSNSGTQGEADAGAGATSSYSASQPALSYNVVLTPGIMMVVPRRSECCGPCAMNSLCYAGTVLVRSEEELQFVRTTGPSNMLAAGGVPWPASSAL